MENWYNNNIEPGIRDVVFLLRNNGINTECSCEHEMYVQFQVILKNDTADKVDDILYISGYRDYKIEITVCREEGYLRTTGTVYFPIKGRYPVQDERISALEQHYSLK